MAKFIIDQQEYDLKDGTMIAEICEDAGIPFSCKNGQCGTCQIEIIEGADNLNKVREEEDALGMDRNNRLSCQCRILRGTVKVTY
ncbi:MAG: ferredoxin [Candidatus Omnitrophota bacterium]|jgi:ferredoxin